MGFSDKPGPTHWHFEQFAQFRLLSKSKTNVLLSHKVGFCIAPTDPVSPLLPHALWQPSFTRFFGACGSPTALSVHGKVPVRRGDTFFPLLPGQAFDITNPPHH